MIRHIYILATACSGYDFSKYGADKLAGICNSDPGCSNSAKTLEKGFSQRVAEVIAAVLPKN